MTMSNNQRINDYTRISPEERRRQYLLETERYDQLEREAIQESEGPGPTAANANKSAVSPGGMATEHYPLPEETTPYVNRAPAELVNALKWSRTNRPKFGDPESKRNMDLLANYICGRCNWCKGTGFRLGLDDLPCHTCDRTGKVWVRK